MKGADHTEPGVYEKKLNKTDHTLKPTSHNTDKNLKFKFGLLGIVICQCDWNKEM